MCIKLKRNFYLPFNIKLQVGVDLQTFHTAQLVYSNPQDLCSDSLSPNDIILAGSEIWKTDGDHHNIKIVTVHILCYAYVKKTKPECMYNKIIINMHIKRCHCLKKLKRKENVK